MAADRSNVTYKKLKGLIPALPPSDVFAKVQGGQQLYAQLRDANSLLKFQDRSLVEQGRLGKMDIRDQRGDALNQVRAGSNERGMLGSSEQFLQELDVKGDASRAIQGVNQQTLQARMQNVAERMQNRRNSEAGLQNLMAMEAAANSDRTIARTFAGMLDGGGGGNGGGGRGGGNGGGGGPNASKRRRLGNQIGKKADAIQTLLKSLESLGSTPSSADQAQVVKKRLWVLFNERNKLRKKLGKKPISKSALRKKINVGGGPSSPGVGTGVML